MGDMMAKAPDASKTVEPLDLIEAAEGGTSAEVDEPDALIEFDGTRWPFRFDDVTPADARTLRLTTGLGLGETVRLALTSVPLDADLGVALLWLARRQAGERVTIADVEAGVTQGNAPRLVPPAEHVESGDHPEA